METVEMKVITPAEAKAILDEQERRIAEGEHTNRDVNDAAIARYANDIRRGHWPVNTHGIGFDTKGNLTNGRNRLWAIVRANLPIKTAVFYGLNPRGNGVISSMDTEDNGRPRTVAQQLKIDGVRYYELMAASSRVVASILCENQDLRLSVMPTREILDLFGTHMTKAIENSGGKNRSLRGHLIGPLAIYRSSDRAKADEFAQQWHERANLDRNSPILALQRYFESPSARGGSGDRQVGRYRHVALALYHFDAGAKINTIRNSNIGCDWLRELVPANTRKVRAMLGLAETQAS